LSVVGFFSAGLSDLSVDGFSAFVSLVSLSLPPVESVDAVSVLSVFPLGT